MKATTAVEQDKQASVTLVDFGSASKMQNSKIEKSPQKTNAKVSNSSLMEASSSMVSLPDVVANAENKNLNVASDGEYTLTALKTKSQNNSAVVLK